MLTQDGSCPFTVHRFLENPVITPYLLGDACENINGPALIRVPDWAPNPLGKYYLYFAHHEGEHIRLAYADTLQGPWKIHAGGVISFTSLSWATDHVSSPDIWIDEQNRQIRLYFHSPVAPMLKSTDPDYLSHGGEILQKTFVALSSDGLDFQVRPEALGPSYFRVWQWQGAFYAFPRLGVPLLRSADGLKPFEALPSPLEHDPIFANIRHCAVWIRDSTLLLFYSRIGDAPEEILLTQIALQGPPETWRPTAPCSVLRPAAGYEGAHLPVKSSVFGMTLCYENALRDPYIYTEDDRIYLLYSVVAERGLAIAELVEK